VKRDGGQRELSTGEVPFGWDRGRWIEYLRDRAMRCGDEQRAKELRDEADAVQRNGYEP
jgi:hypothetical protein